MKKSEPYSVFSKYFTTEYIQSVGVSELIKKQRQ